MFNKCRCPLFLIILWSMVSNMAWAQSVNLALFQENMFWENPAFTALDNERQLLLQRHDQAFLKDVSASVNLLQYQGSTENGGFGLGYAGSVFQNFQEHAFQSAYAQRLELSENTQLFGGLAGGYFLTRTRTPQVIGLSQGFFWNAGAGLKSNQLTIALSYGEKRVPQLRNLFTTYVSYDLTLSKNITLQPMAMLLWLEQDADPNLRFGARLGIREMIDIGLLFDSQRDNAASVAVSVSDKIRLGYALRSSLDGLFQFPTHEFLMIWRI